VKARVEGMEKKPWPFPSSSRQGEVTTSNRLSEKIEVADKMHRRGAAYVNNERGPRSAHDHGKVNLRVVVHLTSCGELNIKLGRKLDIGAVMLESHQASCTASSLYPVESGLDEANSCTHQLTTSA